MTVRSSTRREFLRRSSFGSAALAAWGLADLNHFGNLPVLRAEDVSQPDVVQFRPEIEPLVRLLEETPRDDLLEVVGQRIRGGLSYQHLLAALFLAGIRNIQPRPAVGFKFHGVLAVNAAHLASMASPDELRWLPIFWSLDYFKATQAQDVEEGNWTMSAVNESAVPAADKATAQFAQAMDSWNEGAADAAAAGLARSAGGAGAFAQLFRYGARDFRSIGHKAIYVSNSWRTLNVIGWEHAEPVIRSLAYALQNHQNQDNPAQNDYEADRPWKSNRELAATFRPDWSGGVLSPDATRELLVALRMAASDECCRVVTESINQGVSPQSVWDALFLGGAELLLRQRGIVSLHALTCTNALRFAYDTASDDETRRMLLLQSTAFLPMFRENMKNRGAVADVDIEQVAAEPASGTGPAALEEIFANVSGDRNLAARQTLAALESGLPPEQLIDAARVLIFRKSNDAHDYKFSSAVLEDYYHVSPAFRNRFLAAGVYNLRGSGDSDSSLVERTKAAIG
jgi:hypothetical protein